jgi:hypothetical protein
MKRMTALALGVLFVGLFHGPQAALPQATVPAAHITTPKEALGFNLGDDYCLANYQQLIKYWTKLEKESDRLKVVDMGKTEEGRPQLMGIVTSPANHKKLDYYKWIARKLALAEGLSAAEAKLLAKEGKAVVWIDGGLHASESLCAQVLMETLYQMLVSNDEESLRFLNDCIILFVQANPDGMDLIADNYMQNRAKGGKGGKGGGGGGGRLYQKYIGHDNNRDFYGNTQAETKNMNKVMYREWFPQIVFNHHQTGPAGAVVFIPPCRDPFNYNLDPLVMNGIETLSGAMQSRFLAEQKPGATVRTGAQYSTWWNGGLSTTCQFHNMIGIFTETVGGPNPTNIPFVVNKLLPNSDYLNPITPQQWHFRQSMDYSVTSNKATFDYASRNRELMLYNIWRMGMNSIERGSRDSWTISPKMVALAGGGKGGKGGGGKGGGGGFGGKAGGSVEDFAKYFRDPAKRDPRAYILPADQTDFLTATKFVNALLDSGVKVHRATADFEVANKKYPKGSYVLLTAQAFRPHVIDMFEPQDHPDDIPYPGAAPKKPYDIAGYTMAFTMGVKFDRILSGFEGPFEEIKDSVIPPPSGKVIPVDAAVGYYLDTHLNDAFRAVNQMHAAGQEVRRLQAPSGTRPAGTFYIPRTEKTAALLEKIAKEVGTSFEGTKEAPGKEAAVVKQARIALYDTGNSMPAGWTRWILEKMEFPYKSVKGGTLDKYDVLILADGGSWDTPDAKSFLEKGGTILAVGSATSIGTELGLPLPRHVKQSGDQYYIPMSVLQVKMDTSNPLAWGMEDHADVMFSNSPTFKITPEAAEKFGMTKLAWFDSKTPLRSGWAMGQQYLEGGVPMIDVKMGKGRLALFGPQVTFRAQPHGTFKLIFNGIVQASVPRE